MTFNWAALGISALGAVLGGAAGALGAGFVNRPLAGPALVGAALGAIVASVATPKGASASPSVASSSTSSTTPTTHALTAADAGTTVQARVGDTLTLTEPTPAGAAWSYAPTSPALTYVGKTTAGTTSATDTQTDTWTAAAAGTTTLQGTQVHGGAVTIPVVVSP